MQDVCTILLPAILELCGDPIAAVRRAAAQQVGCVLSTMGLLTPGCSRPRDGSAQDVVAQVCSLARSSSFQRRVSYAHAFENITRHASEQDACALFLPSYLALANDPVLDVRLAAFYMLSVMAEPYEDGMPHSRQDASAAASHIPPGVLAVLNDTRIHEVVDGAAADVNTAVAQMACMCKKQLSSVVLCNDA